MYIYKLIYTQHSLEYNNKIKRFCFFFAYGVTKTYLYELVYIIYICAYMYVYLYIYASEYMYVYKHKCKQPCTYKHTNKYPQSPRI